MSKTPLRAAAACAVVAVSGAAAPAASASILFNGTFVNPSSPSQTLYSSPDRSFFAWDGTQSVAGSRLRTIPNGVPTSVEPAKNILRSEVRSGDLYTSGGYSAPRSEVYGRVSPYGWKASWSTWPDPAGSTRYYGFSIYLSSASFPTATDTKWAVLTQWKGFHGGQPPISLAVKKNDFQLDGSRIINSVGRKNLGPIAFNRWTRFVFGIRWVSNSNTGFVTVYRDNTLVASVRNIRTMDRYSGAPDPVYLKQGIYRSDAWNDTQVAYYGPMVVGTSSADVVRSLG